jgi:hypothetical protein
MSLEGSTPSPSARSSRTCGIGLAARVASNQATGVRFPDPALNGISFVRTHRYNVRMIPFRCRVARIQLFTRNYPTFRKANLMGTAHEATLSNSLTMSGTVTARVVRNLAMTRDANELLASVAEETGLDEGDVLRLALGMFKVAVDAKRNGKHIGVSGSPEALDLELTGF